MTYGCIIIIAAISGALNFLAAMEQMFKCFVMRNASIMDLP
jgi:hypothetical protein